MTDEQLNASLKTQLQAPTQTPSANPANGAISKVGSLARSQFHWTHALYAVGLLSVSGAATAVLFKVYLLCTSMMAVTFNYF